MSSIEKTAKTVDEAVRDALASLNATIDQVEVTIIDAGTKGILGFGSKPAKVLVTKKFDPEETAKNFIREVAIAMEMVVEVETKMKERQLDVILSGDNMGIFIGKRGQTLDALQYLLNLVVNKGSAPYISITLDTENYRKRRKDTLEALAISLARKAKQTKRKVVLEPMNPYERRIIHSVLQNDKYVTTFSEGDEPYRNVVILPK